MINVEVNTQQILNMGSQVEKLQHKMQHLPTITAEQLESERAKLDELKRLEVQNIVNTSEGNPVNPDSEGNKRRRLKIHRPSAALPDEAESKPDTALELSDGHKINLIV